MPSAVHISFNVSDLSRSTDFYRRFFGEPKKLEADYVKFVAEDPEIHLALQPGRTSAVAKIGKIQVAMAVDEHALKPLTGKTLAAVAASRGKSPEETAIDLVIENGNDVSTVYFWMCEENVRKQLTLPWVSFGSDSSSLAFLES